MTSIQYPNMAGPSNYTSDVRTSPLTPVSPEDTTRTQPQTRNNHVSNPSQSSIASTSASTHTNHVQAIHDFHYSLLASTATSNPGTYLSFQAGDVIRVHTRDPSGWWDGEISGSASEWSMDAETERTEMGPRRGWFPSNYVREMGWDASHQRTSSSVSTSSPSSSVQANQYHSRNDSVASHISRASTSTSASHARSHSNHHHSHSRHTSASHSRPASKPLSSDVQDLLHPIVQALSVLESAIHSNRKPHIQPATACVISAIRSALSQTDCLSKESMTLVSWPILAKERKVVLVELSRLVGCARSASGITDPTETGVRPNADEAKELDALAKAARGVFSSVKRFLHLANDCGVTVTPRPIEEASEVVASKPGSSGTPSAYNDETRRKLKTRTPSASSMRMQEAFRIKAASIGDLRAARRRASSPPPPLPISGTLRSVTPSQDTPVSATFQSSSSGRSSPVSTRSTNFRPRPLEGSSFSSVTSTTTSDSQITSEENVPSPANAPDGTIANLLGSVQHIHEAISVAEDALLSVIAAFIGHIHSHNISSHPSSHSFLIELTRETIDSVRELLTIVETVGRHAGIRAARAREIENLRIAKDALYDVASRLVEGSEAVADAPFEEIGEEDYDVEKGRLLQAATGTLRSGTECVRLVKLCLPENNGSWGLDNTPRQSMDDRRNSLVGTKSTVRTVGPREKLVGERGVHTLSGLHRKANSLNHLQQRYRDDGQFGSAPSERDEDEGDENDEEEVVGDLVIEEDVTLRPLDGSLRSIGGSPRPQIQQARTFSGHLSQFPHAPVMSRQNLSDTGPNTATPRSRALSLSSPALPPRLERRSPSRSADLDKFTGDYPVPSEIRRESMNTSSSTSSTQASHSSKISAITNATSVLSSTTGLSHGPPGAHQGEMMSDYTNLDSLPKNALLAVDPRNRLASLKIETDEISRTGPKAGSQPTRPAPPVRSLTTPNAVAYPDPRLWVVAHDYDPREIAFNSEGIMVGGTLEVIVEKMTPHDTTVDQLFWASFFLTFRLFTTPTKLLETVVRRYDLQPPPSATFGDRERAVWVERKVVPVRLRIYNFLKTWLEVHWRPQSDDVVLPTLYDFARDVMSTTLPAMAPRLMDAVRKRQDPPPSAAGSEASSLNRTSIGDRLRYNTSALSLPLQNSPTSAITMATSISMSSTLPPTPIINQKLHNNLRNKSLSINITEFDALELARQFTLMESKLFVQILPEDLLMTGKKSIPQLKALSTLSNQVTGWVADGILNEMNPKRRAELLKFYIKLADKCLALNNFSTLFAVLAGLNSSTILRLKKTWDALSTKYRTIMDRLRGVIEHTKNHAAYRARLREVTGPCLPFLGLILTDITFTSDGNPNTRPSTLDPDLQLINQDKYTKLAKIALDFQRYQQPFHFVEIVEVQDFLQRVLTERGSGSLDALYRKSLMLEPRQVSEKLNSAVEKPGWLGGRI